MAESCDSKEVVRRLSESLEQLSFTEPGPNTKKLVCCLARKAKYSNRLDGLDEVNHLRYITPSGTTGRFLIDLTLYVQNNKINRRVFLYFTPAAAAAALFGLNSGC